MLGCMFVIYQVQEKLLSLTQPQGCTKHPFQVVFPCSSPASGSPHFPTVLHLGSPPWHAVFELDFLSHLSWVLLFLNTTPCFSEVGLLHVFSPPSSFLFTYFCLSCSFHHFKQCTSSRPTSCLAFSSCSSPH